MGYEFSIICYNCQSPEEGIAGVHVGGQYPPRLISFCPFKALGDGLITPSHKIPRGLLFPCAARAGFPWNGVSLVLEGLAEHRAGTQLLPGHAPATLSRSCCHIRHVSCWCLPMERPLQKEKKNQGVSKCPRLWRAA